MIHSISLIRISCDSRKEIFKCRDTRRNWACYRLVKLTLLLWQCFSNFKSLSNLLGHNQNFLFNKVDHKRKNIRVYQCGKVKCFVTLVCVYVYLFITASLNLKSLKDTALEVVLLQLRTSELKLQRKSEVQKKTKFFKAGRYLKDLLISSFYEWGYWQSQK